MTRCKLRIEWMLPMVAAGLFSLVGCDSEPVGKPHTHDDAAELTLCGKCGEVKGSEKCCKDGVEICETCMLHKGSVLCCSSAIDGRKDVILCRRCGEVAFTDKCCRSGKAESAKLCEKCGLHKNSPGCCRIEKVVDDGPHDGHDDNA